MVIGSGLLGKRFATYSDDEHFLIFASGVSNSSTTDNAAFLRERTLLEESIAAHPEKTFVYFSTCSIYDKALQEKPYVRHKKSMEALIATKCAHYYIFRISNLAGKTPNPHTVLNYFYFHLKEKQHFQVWNHAYRNIIDVDDTFTIVDNILRRHNFENEITNIANPHNCSALEIVQTMEKLLDWKGDYDIVEKSTFPTIDVEKIQPIIEQLSINFGADYLQELIRKYYLQ